MTDFEITPMNKMEYLNLCLIHEWGAEFNAQQRFKLVERSKPNAQELLESVE